jgi:hypothetical protein
VFRLRLPTLLARVLTMLICWSILMGVPVLLFKGPFTEPGELKRFLGVFYALLLALGALVGRSWGWPGVVGVALPFVMFFSMLGASKLLDPSLSTAEKLGWGLNFGAIYAVVWLSGRLGKLWHKNDKTSPFGS